MAQNRGRLVSPPHPKKKKKKSATEEGCKESDISYVRLRELSLFVWRPGGTGGGCKGGGGGTGLVG